MVQPLDATDSFQPLPQMRRYTDPPNFWVKVVTGSIALHLLALACLPQLLRATLSQSATGEVTATPIELVEVPASSGGQSSTSNPTTVAPTATESASAPSAPTQETAPVPPPQSPVENRPQPTVFEPQPVPQPTTPDVAPPVPTPSPNQDFTPPDTTAVESPEPTPSSPTQPGDLPLQSPSTPPTNASPVPDTITGQPIPNQPPAPSEDTVGSGYPSDTETNPSGEGTDTSNPPSGNGTGDDLGEVGVNSEPAPTSLTASLVGVNQVDPTESRGDDPEQDAVPVQQMDFVADPVNPGSCIIPPASVAFFGQPVSFRVTVEQDGRVSATELRDPAPASADYIELTSCLIRNWQFTPASTAGIAIASDNLIVTVSVRASQ